MYAIEWMDGKVRFLDQTKLPLEEVYVETSDVQVIADAIKRLAVRGAPLIGVAAAYGVALAVQTMVDTNKSEFSSAIEKAVSLLAATRPTAINLFWALNRMQKIDASHTESSIRLRKDSLIDEARKIHNEDIAMCESIAENGIELLEDDATILTHCNTGALATGGRGTALNVIRKGWELGKVKHVYIDETRPLLQGARLTSWELGKLEITHTLITDSTAALLMHQKKISCVIVGADRIASNGDVANKIGTYSVAVNARYHQIPFFVAAPVSTIDFGLHSGKEIQIEIRDGSEVAQIGDYRLAPPDVDVYAPAFDVTPNELVSAIITDKGIARYPYSKSLDRMRTERVELDAR